MSIAVSGPSPAAVAGHATGRDARAQHDSGTWNDTYAAAHAAPDATSPSARTARAQEDPAAPATNRPPAPGKEVGQQTARALAARDPQLASADPAAGVQKATPSRRQPSPAGDNGSLLSPASSSAEEQGPGSSAPAQDVAGNAPNAAKPSLPAASNPVQPSADGRPHTASTTTRKPAAREDVHPLATAAVPPQAGRAQTDHPSADQPVDPASPAAEDSSLGPPLTPPQDKKSWHLASGQHAAPSPLATNLLPTGHHLPPPQTGIGTNQIGAPAPASTGTGHGSIAAAAPSVASVMSAPSPHVAPLHAAAATPDPQPPGQPAQTLLQQTTAGLALDNGGMAHVTLHPPTLGRVTVQVTMAPSGTAHIQITAATSDGYAALTASNAALLNHLADRGVSVGSMQMQMQSDAGHGGASSGNDNGHGGRQPPQAIRWVPQTSDKAVIAYA